MESGVTPSRLPRIDVGVAAQRQMNKYDDVRFDVSQLLEKQELKPSLYSPDAKSGDDLGLLSALAVRVKLYLTALLYKTGVHKRLIYANAKLDWFYEFRDYWVRELGYRPIEPHDFYFLSGLYRQKFSNLDVLDSATNEQHIQAWQDPRTVYLLFRYQLQLALRPLCAHRFTRYIRRGGNVCEYGCGLAPIATSLCRFYPHLNVNISLADIPTVLFHFVRWKFSGKEYVRTVEINPNNDEPLGADFDIIFCQTVLEHVPRPLSVVRHLHARIRSGGFFVFDYIKSEGKGLDTASALRDRTTVLQYIVDNFEVVEGRVFLDERNVGTVVCRKP